MLAIYYRLNDIKGRGEQIFSSDSWFNKAFQQKKADIAVVGLATWPVQELKLEKLTRPIFLDGIQLAFYKNSMPQVGSFLLTMTRKLELSNSTPDSVHY